jgi:hypothetical protein
MSTQIFDIIKNKDSFLEGCSDEEIKQIGLIAKGHLPSSYKTYLKLMGRKAFFLEGDSCFIDELPFLKHWAVELLTRNKLEICLKKTDFVFWMSQGVMFCFFNLEEGEDPPIYCFVEYPNQYSFYKICDSFTEFLQRRFFLDKTLFINSKQSPYE